MKYRYVQPAPGVGDVFLPDGEGGLVRVAIGDKPTKLPEGLLKSGRARAFIADGRLLEVEPPKKKKAQDDEE